MKLKDRMEFDHVILVTPGGNVESASGVYAPEIFMGATEDGDILATHEAEYVADAERQGWTLESGWTGQYSYNGVIMHQSEFIGGRLADHIRCTPGYWVAMVVDAGGEEPAGWVVAHKPVERPSGVYRCPCCGDDYAGSEWTCGGCQGHGCEQSIDASGDVGYFECQRDPGRYEDDDPETDCTDPECPGCLYCIPGA